MVLRMAPQGQQRSHAPTTTSSCSPHQAKQVEAWHHSKHPSQISGLGHPTSNLSSAATSLRCSSLSLSPDATSWSCVGDEEDDRGADVRYNHCD